MPEAKSASRPQIKTSDRVFVAGQTGSGKTYLVSKMAAQFPNVIVFDDKGTFPAISQRCERVTSLRALMRKREGHYIFTPSVDSGELFDDELVNKFFEWCYKRGNTIVIVDESYAITKGQELCYWLKACITRGREKNVGVWALSQRPKMIPNFLMSEAQHVFVFRLTLGTDYKKLEEIVGPAVNEPLDEYAHHYFGIGTGEHHIGRA